MKQDIQNIVEELLRLRYKVIADYPLSVCKIGQILYVDNEGDFIPIIQGGYWKTDISQYPHLFRKLFWWEERKDSEMPVYVKYENNVYKIIDWDVTGIVSCHVEKIDFSEDGYLFFASMINPATEAEYNNQQKQVKE